MPSSEASITACPSMLSCQANPSEGIALCGRVILVPLRPLVPVPSVSEHSDLDFKSAVLDFLVGDVTGKRGFLIVGDFFGDTDPENPSL